MKTFKIPLVWQCYGVANVEAETIEEAKELALGPEVSLPDGEYVEDSCELDSEDIINEMNQIKNRHGKK